ncbi:MAG TPA: glycoside hydrolase family 32 protein [Verrucomicrobiae bacterium]|nr:glycoside hydrolase family 32 protein [Verrucomicrobiae bacterium]
MSRIEGWPELRYDKRGVWDRGSGVPPLAWRRDASATLLVLAPFSPDPFLLKCQFVNLIRSTILALIFLSQARGQVESTRPLQLGGRLLNIPISNGEPKQMVRLEVAGKTVRECEVEVASKAPDLWVFVDVSPWRGKEATLRGPAAAIAAIECGDEVKAREPVYSERLRPQFHFSSIRGRLNDPNGLLYFGGEYHLFYQLHPYGVKSGSKSWGHAVSRDLVRWQELPIAIHADEEGMMFSGSGVVDWKNTSGFQRGSEPPLVLIYTATGPPRAQCLAYSNDRGCTWTKFEGNPVLPEVEHNNRDPKVFWHQPTQRWVMILHCTPRGKKLPVDPKDPKRRTGELGIFTSPDLKQWTSASRIAGFYECPDLFPMKVEGTGETMWIVHGGSGEYQVGDFDGHRFTPRSGMLHGPYGGAFYAGQTFSDMPGGRVVQLGWARMSDAAFAGMPFSQMMNFPCDLTLGPTEKGPRLAWQPVREIESLRARHHHIAAGVLDDKGFPMEDVQSEFFDMRAEIGVNTAREIELSIRGTPFVIEVAKQSLVSGKAAMPMPVKDGRVRFRLLSDRALVEVFTDDGKRFGAFSHIPVPDAPIAPEFVARGGTAKIVSLDLDELLSAWPTPAARK